MPIRVTLDRMLLERRMSLTELCDRVGITMANLSILKTGKAKAIRFSTLEEAIRIANDTEYGLGGAVVTRSLDRAMQVSHQLRALDPPRELVRLVA